MADSQKNIPILWFDNRGSGPDHVELLLRSMAEDDYMPALGIQILAGSEPGDLGIGEVARRMLQGGFMIAPGPVAELHRRIGTWLADHPHCPGCAENMATYDDMERAKIPLRHAAHNFSQAADADHHEPDIGEVAKRRDVELAAAALEYARKLGWTPPAKP